MAASRAQEIRVGVVSVLALVIVIGGILWGKGMGLGVDNRTVVISFQNASGVEIGSPLMYRGVRKGAVTAISVNPDGVRVTAVVESSGVPLHRDASASLQMLEVMGGRKIELNAGTSPEPLPDGAVIPGFVEGDISALLSSVGDISADAQQLMRRADSAIGAVNAILNSPELRRNIETSSTNLAAASQGARELIDENKTSIRRIVANVDALAADVRQFVARTETSLDRTMVTADSAVSDARKTIRLADGTLRDADRLILRIDSLAVEIKSGNGVVARLIGDKALADELMTTLTRTRELVEQVKRQGFNLNIGFGRGK